MAFFFQIYTIGILFGFVYSVVAELDNSLFSVLNLVFSAYLQTTLLANS